MSYVLGISAFYHDSAVTLLKDGEIISAVQEERLSRIKHDPSFPQNAIKEILFRENVKLSNIESICFYEKPFLKFERLLETYISHAPKGYLSFRKSMPIWLKEKLFQKNLIMSELKKIDRNFTGKLYFAEHHLSHAASAFYPSPFEEAAILTIDGVGEWATTTISIGNKNKIKILEEIHYPHSIGLLYSAFTYYLGFRVNSGEYKVMGLAPYGTPKYTNKILHKIIDLKEDGSFRLDQKYFDYSTGLKMINEEFELLFGKPARRFDDEKIEQFHMDIAASIQDVIEKIVLNISDYIYKKYRVENLCLAGGVALNCVANTKIQNNGKFKKIWVQPAAGDAGGSLGAALLYWHDKTNRKRIINKNDSMKGSYLGFSYSNDEIANDLDKVGAKYERLDDESIISMSAKLISEGKIIGWFQGCMEFGPRALGARSILADPRSLNMQENLNKKIKFRESFRPFAPAILETYKDDWFSLKSNSPYMLFIAELVESKKIFSSNKENLTGFDLLSVARSDVPGVTHVDFSARVQTVNNDYNHKFFNLIKKFYEITKCPMLINTSFNVRGEPIVCSPIDAYRCFMGTEMDTLIIGNYILSKDLETNLVDLSYSRNFKKD